MTLKPFLPYVHSLVDTPGVAGSANTFMSFHNPVGSGVVAAALLFDTTAYSVGAAAVAESLEIFRISAASGGTQIAAADVHRFNTLHQDPKVEVRVDNPTVTTVGTPLRGVAPPITTGVGGNLAFFTAVPSGTSFLFYPGQGIAFRTSDGDADIRWNLTYIWIEVS